MTMKCFVGAAHAAIVLFAVLFAGCASLDVSHTTSPAYGRVSPATIAVLPAAWKDAQAVLTDEDRRVARILTDLVAEQIKSGNYAVIGADSAAAGAAAGLRGADDAQKYSEIARALNADAVVAPVISDWTKSSHVAGYVSLKFKADFIMVAVDGTVLWSASSEAKESDMPLPMSVRSDREAVEVSLLKAYEARLQRYVDAAFSSLPPKSVKAQRKAYFDWLP